MRFSIRWFGVRFFSTLLIALLAGYKFAENNHKYYWQDKWFSDKGAGSYYTLLLIVTLTGWGVAIAAAEFFQYTRRDRQREKTRY